MKQIQNQIRSQGIHSEKARHLPRASFGLEHHLPAPGQKLRGGLLLLQEIFGLKAEMRAKAARYAEMGFHVALPAFFDHFEPGLLLDYGDSGVQRGRQLITDLTFDQAVEDVRLSCQSLRSEHRDLKIAVIGYCWGGSVAWLSACRLNGEVDAAVCYYGRHAWEFRNEKPRCPVLMHYGESDPSIPLSQVEDMRRLHSEVSVQIFPGSHAFAREGENVFHAESASRAEMQTLSFLNANGFAQPA